MTNIIQLSDCHIGQSELTSAHLKHVVSSVQQTSYDAVVVTGDIAHNGLLSEYLEFLYIIKDLTNVYALAGNHDSYANMKKAFQPWQLEGFVCGEWNIALVESKVLHKVSGYIDLVALRDQTRSIVFTHHPICSMQSSWDDSISISNMHEVNSALHSGIRMLAFGHAHQAKDFMLGEIKVYSCPSSAYGFEDKQEYGYNIYSLSEDAVHKQTVVL